VRLDPLAHGARDARDILKHARSVGEVVRALAPARLSPPLVLNDGAAPGATPAATGLAAALAVLRRRLQADVFTPEGQVDYARLAGADADPELNQ
jgi:hypothetical protein